MRVNSHLCVRCGAPLSQAASVEGRKCDFCGSLQPSAPRPNTDHVRAVVRNVLEEDRRRAEQPVNVDTKTFVYVGVLVVGIMVLCGVIVAVLIRGEPELEPEPYVPPAPVAIVQPPPPPSIPEPPPPQREPVIPDGPVVTFEEEKPKPKPKRPKTNNEWAKPIVASKRKDLLMCLQQELVRRPASSKSYEVTVPLDEDAQSIFSQVTISPPSSEQLRQCVAHAMRWGFQRVAEASQYPPQKCPCVVTASFAFPDAQPAAEKDDRF